MTGPTDVNEDEGKRVRLLLESMEADARLANALSGFIGSRRPVERRLALLRRLAGDVESVLVDESSLKALKEMDRYLLMKEKDLDPFTAAHLGAAKDMLAYADKGLDGTISRYREMVVWSTMEPRSALAFNEAWSNAISAASLVRTVALCAHHYECNQVLPGWLPMQAYAMWRSFTLVASEKDGLRTAIVRAGELLVELRAVDGEGVGHGP